MNDNRRVYSIPVRIYLRCRLFILAPDEAHARRTVRHIHLEDYYSFTDHSVTTDGAKLLRVDDVVTFPIDDVVVDITQLTLDAYPPNTHPDFVGIPER